MLQILLLNLFLALSNSSSVSEMASQINLSFFMFARISAHTSITYHMVSIFLQFSSFSCLLENYLIKVMQPLRFPGWPYRQQYNCFLFIQRPTKNTQLTLFRPIWHAGLHCSLKFTYSVKAKVFRLHFWGLDG